MDIQTEKIELAKLLLDTEDPKIIESVKNIFKNINNKDFWDELSYEEQKEIELGTKQIKEGKSTDYESFISKYRD